jgi:ubiquinone/menaquinone biosynthesis C-methylase UbiE
MPRIRRKIYQDKGIYRIKGNLPFQKLFLRKSAERYRLLLIDKWKYLRKCKKVLDAGCGIGTFLSLNPYNAEVQGIDFSKEEVQKARLKGVNARVADLNKRLPFKDNEFDAVTCFHVIEHLDNPDNMLREFKRILKKGGILMVAVPNHSFKKFYADYTHKRPYPKEALYRILDDYGFRDIRIKKGFHLSRLVSSVFFLFPRARYSIEKFLGKFSPWEHLAISRNYK